MNSMMCKFAIIISGVLGALFTFILVEQPATPLYHNILLMGVSWLLFYSFIDIALEPIKSMKIRRCDKIHQSINTVPEESK